GGEHRDGACGDRGAEVPVRAGVVAAACTNARRVRPDSRSRATVVKYRLSSSERPQATTRFVDVGGASAETETEQPRIAPQRGESSPRYGGDACLREKFPRRLVRVVETAFREAGEHEACPFGALRVETSILEGRDEPIAFAFIGGAELIVVRDRHLQPRDR